MHPANYAKTNPDLPAYIMTDTKEIVTYKQLNDRSIQASHLLREHGLKRGDAIVIFLENHLRFLELCWAAQRAGLYFTTISSRLATPEIEYILGDLKPKAFFTSKKLINVAKGVSQLASKEIPAYLVDDGEQEPFMSYLIAQCQCPQIPFDHSSEVD